MTIEIKHRGGIAEVKHKIFNVKHSFSIDYYVNDD